MVVAPQSVKELEVKRGWVMSSHEWNVWWRAVIVMPLLHT
jgi:hypothetical protein